MIKTKNYSYKVFVTLLFGFAGLSQGEWQKLIFTVTDVAPPDAFDGEDELLDDLQDRVLRQMGLDPDDHPRGQIYEGKRIDLFLFGHQAHDDLYPEKFEFIANGYKVPQDDDYFWGDSAVDSFDPPDVDDYEYRSYED